MVTVDVMGLLKGIMPFAVLPDQELALVAAKLELIHVPLGKSVIREGDQSDAFYIVYSGRARVVALDQRGEEVTVGISTRGDSFGEQGLLKGTRRANTVRAAEDLAMLRMAGEEFLRCIEAHAELRAYYTDYVSEIALRNFLRLCTVFQPLSVLDTQQLVRALQPLNFASGEAIVREGEEGDAYYILRTGSARVVKESPSGTTVIGRLRQGDGFGEMALLTGQRRAATVIADESTSVLRLEKSDFDQVCATMPQVKEALMAAAAGYARDDGEQGGPQVGLGGAPVDAIPAELPEAPASSESAYQPKRSRKYPALLQLSEMDCGAACLAMILRYYGKYVSINRLRDLANVSRDGSNLYSLAAAAETLGFQTRGIRAQFEHLLKAELPAIAHWEGYHFIVVYQVTNDHVTVADPAIGLRRLTREEFSKGWTGFLLLLTPTPKMETVASSRTTYRRFLPLILPHRRLLGEVLLASLVLQLFGLASPIFTQVIVDHAILHKDVSLLNEMLIGMVIVALFQTATGAMRQFLLIHTTRRIDLQMVVSFFDHLLALPLRYFQDRKTGDIVRRFQDNAILRNLLTGRAIGVIIDSVMIVVYLSLMMVYNVHLTFAALVFIPAYAILTLAMTPLLQRQFRESFEKIANSESYMIEAVTGIGTVKSAAAERRVRWKLEGLVVQGMNVEFRGAMLWTGVHSAATILSTGSTVILFWYGARLVMAGQLTLGQLVAFNVLVGMVMMPILNVIDLWHDIQEANMALERLNEVFDTKRETESGSQSGIKLPRVRGHVRFENVTFRYPSRPDKNVLQNINLEILPGQTVALVGRSGAGKSTFANLLLRLYEPTEGRIMVDGYDLRQVDHSSLRAQVGVVPQDVFLFSGTIRENIAFADPDKPIDQVVGAAMLAGAHEFVSGLPLGYETQIGERGQSLSGGQKQRIVIARALFRRPRILLFDEATSALDTESERAIQQNLESILKDRTTVVIAHRLSTIRNADLIVVMDGGMIVETGDHYSLMEQKGLYYYLHSQQLDG